MAKHAPVGEAKVNRITTDIQLRAILDGVIEAVVAIDEHGTLTFVNRAAELMFGYEEKELVGSSINTLIPAYGKHEHCMVHDQDAPQPSPVGSEQEMAGRRKDGSMFPVRLDFGTCGREDHAVSTAVVRNLTESKRAADATARHRAELARVARIGLLAELVASIAHEISQPLTSIVTNACAAQRFLRAPSPDLTEVAEALKDIRSSGRLAGEIIARTRQLLRHGPGNAANTDINRAILDLNYLIVPDARQHQVRVSTRLAEQLPLVRADKRQIQQVVLNLVRNAIDALRDVAGRRREVFVSTTVDKERIVVSVQDNGAGCSVDAIDLMFELFYTTKRDGLGMGLSISRSMIEAHGGMMWAERNDDTGMSFHFSLPCEQAIFDTEQP